MKFEPPKRHNPLIVGKAGAKPVQFLMHQNLKLVQIIRPKIPPARNILGMTGQQAIAHIASARSVVPVKPALFPRIHGRHATHQRVVVTENQSVTGRSSSCLCDSTGIRCRISNSAAKWPISHHLWVLRMYGTRLAYVPFSCSRICATPSA